MDYASSDEEDVYMKSKSEDEEITDLQDLRLDLDRFQQVLIMCVFENVGGHCSGGAEEQC